MPTKRAILAELTRDELRTRLDHYELEVEDRRVNAQLVDALVRSRRASLDEILPALSLDRLKELCRAFDRDDSGRKKADLAARLMGRTAARPDVPKRRQRTVSAPPTPTPQPALSVRQPWAWALLYGGKTIENRRWWTRHRGRIWIHASERENRANVEEAVRLVAQSRKCDPRQVIEHYREHAHRRAILGSMTLTDCCRLDELDRNDPLGSSPWADGPWLWLVTDPVPLDDPWPTPGRLRLWLPPR
ncbi:MAG: ASCH domain-containing protein [Acidobacteria bacterium]|nr:ASCH domain-containing protein [Acidobacteriota bacterium]